MKVAVSVIGKFHSFDLARELHGRGMLEKIFTGYPRFKLRQEQLPDDRIDSFPYLQALYMGLPGRDRLGRAVLREWEWRSKISFDRHVARCLPACDVFVGLSGSALRSGRLARQRGARYVCDRGSSHIRAQDKILREEHERWGLRFDGIDPRVIEQEEAEYAEADCITVPSGFNVRSFVEAGVPAAKLRRLPYGVDLSRFAPTGNPKEGGFDVLFVGGMSLRKGVPYLLQAYQRLVHPQKTLTFAGAVSPEVVALMKSRGHWPEAVRLLGHVPQPQLKELMSRSHVLVLPSIEEGLALVQAQALACGCVVVASSHTGAEDLFTDGEEGFIVRMRDADALADRLQRLADDPCLRSGMSQKALLCVQQVGGWTAYGNRAVAAYQEPRT
jgi:glycosyltransferase involved in cell wall biosynthesis